MTINLNFSLNAWIKELQIEAVSEEAAIEKLKSMTLSEIINDETCFAASEVDILDIDIEILDFDLIVEVSDVVYDFDSESIDSKVAKYLEGILPKTFKLTLSNVKSVDEVEDMIREEIFDQTNYETADFNFKVIEKR